MSETCRNCIHYDTSSRDGINSSKCYCSEKDRYEYPDSSCPDFKKK